MATICISKMKKIAITLFLVWASLFSFAEEVDKERKPDTMLFGDVVTEKDEHVPFAAIVVKGTNIGTSADLSGHYKFTGVPVGAHTVVVSAVGYKSAEFKVKLEEGKPITLRMYVEPDLIGIEQVVVSADRAEKSRRDAGVIVNSISPKLMERTQSVTLSEGLNFTPGLRMENNCQNCGFTQVRMNGLEGHYSQILINSRPVFSGLAGVYGLELIPANMIDRIEVVRGGGSALFGGNAIAGTINLITKEPVRNGFNTSASTGFIGDDAALDYNLNFNGSIVSDDNRSGASLYGFKRKRDHFDANGDGYSELSDLENATFGSSLFYRVGYRSKINLDYFYIQESRRGGNAFDKLKHEADICEAVDHRINSASLSFDHFMKDHDKFTVYSALQSVDRDSYYGANQDPSAYGKTTDFSYNLGTQLHKDLDKFLFTGSELVLGAEFSSTNMEDTKLGYYDTETATHTDNTQVADQRVSTIGAFIQNEWIWEKFRMSVGLRGEHYDVKDLAKDGETVSGEVLSPRVTLLYNVSPKLQFRGSYAKGYRAPQIFDEDLHIETSGARRVTRVNDENLKQETSHSFTLSGDYTQQFGRVITQFLAEGFYTKLQDPFTADYGTPDEEGNVVYTRMNAEDGAVVKGINLELNLSMGNKLLWQSGFTIQSSRYEAVQEFDEKRFFRTPDNYGYLSMTWSPTLRFRVSMTGNYTGKMLVPYFGPDQDDPETGELHRSPTFFDFGTKLSHDFRLNDDLNLQLYGGVKNLFNAYQDDFDSGIDRDPAYMYGPLSPRMFYIGVKLGNIL